MKTMKDSFFNLKKDFIKMQQSFSFILNTRLKAKDNNKESNTLLNTNIDIDQQLMMYNTYT